LARKGGVNDELLEVVHRLFTGALDRRKLHSSLGSVTWERQQAIKSKLKEVFRF